MQPLIQVKDLSIHFAQQQGETTAVNKINFNIYAGKITALIGESGSGKSATALCFLQLLAKNSRTNGTILFTDSQGKTLNLLEQTNPQIQAIRGNKIAMIFQEPMSSLNPIQTCGAQVVEAILQHKKISKAEAKAQALALFTQVELPQPERMFNRYPHQISGGQKQRVMIAMAISCNPLLLIADEPTTALDVRVQKNILLLLKKLQLQHNMGILLITHDLNLVSNIADTVAVLYKGNIVEVNDTITLLQQPVHQYTKALLACKPSSKNKGKKLITVADAMQPLRIDDQLLPTSITSDEQALVVKNLTVEFATNNNLFGKPTQFYKAVNDVSFTIYKNEIVGLVGESGCGKTTLGRTILGLIKPTAGNIFINDLDIVHASKQQLQLIRKELQIVFQDPFSSLNPRLSIGDAIMEPMLVHGFTKNKNHSKQKAIHLLEEVHLQADMFDRLPHQFSGGQRQRICIARALAMQPNFLIFDESVSALDVSVQAQVLNLINELKAKLKFTGIFISHDLAVVQYISDRVMVMQQGNMVEINSAEQIFNHPTHPYTQALVAELVN